MSVAIFTPTSRPGGLDVLEASLKRQTNQDFWWFVVDDLYEKRIEVWDRLRAEFNDKVTNIKLGPKTKHRNLCEAYNMAAKLVLLDGSFNLFVSLQDYIWIPPDGIERFVNTHEERPNDLITGVTHISDVPSPSTVSDKYGGYTIFSRPFTGKPESLNWEDVRVSEIYTGYDQGALLSVEPGHFEANWAAIPVSKFKEGIFWDEEYDQGVAYENCDFAQRATRETNCEILLDTGNVAISLPHKDYFDGEREDILNHTNRWLYESKW